MQALPQFYAQNEGCKVPQRSFGQHGAPRLDKSIEFEIWQNQRDNLVDEWEPRSVYNISVRVRHCLVKRKLVCLCTAAGSWPQRIYACRALAEPCCALMPVLII